MNLSMKWLSDYIDVRDIPVKKFCYDMTMSGSKVEGFETEGDEISNVVVGKILSVVPHENSDHLVVCQVDVGKQSPVQIVTGASNVNEGDIVPVALDGSTLPNGVKIKRGKLRGVESQGMLCSLSELELTIHDFPYAIADGIFIMQEESGCNPFIIGQDIKEAIGLCDTRVEFEITSNRPDCLSVLGLAREAHATFGRPLEIKEPIFSGADKTDINSILKVEILDKKLCQRYIAGVVKNVKITSSPRWMRERLRASGIRPINNLVDITNYVMLEYGHPMHAFDIRCIDNASINIRTANSGEKITTLDGVERVLTSQMLVIADENKPVAIAGIMGGEYSGITDDTTTVVFESASFDGASVRTTAKALGMRSDASARFEKGLDPQNALPALKRAFELVELLGVGEVVSKIIDVDFSSKTPKAVEFNPEWINKFLGTSIPKSDMVSYLTSLGFTFDENNVYAPSVRIDIECKADIAEEVARIYGYNNIPQTIIKGVAKAMLTPEQQFERKIMSTMTSLGANEITTYSFISPSFFDKIRLPDDSILRKTVTITNPLGEDTSVMRTTVLPSMCGILAGNYNSRNMSACLFEMGSEYIPTDEGKLPDEPARLSIGLYGNGSDFYDIKGITEQLLEAVGITGFEVSACTGENEFPEYPAFHSGRCAIISKAGVNLGILGELHPEVLENYEIGTKAYVAKLNIPEMMSVAEIEKTYKPLPKFPATARDIAIVCDEKLPASALEKAITIAVGSILEKVTLFDVYKGKQIASDKKSVAYSISMRSHEGTLTDEQADSAVKRILKELAKLGAELRT